jgi:hypothetical protein
MSSKKYGVGKFISGLASYRVPLEVTSSFVEKYLIALDCPRALTVLILWRNSEWEQIAKLEYDPLHYNSVKGVRDSYAATKFLSKFKDFSLDYDLDEVAIKKFEEFELLCKETNNRFRHLVSDPLYKGQIVWLHHAAIRKIAECLGDCSFDEFFSRADWGPGATTLMKRRHASSSNKFQHEAGITRDLYALLPKTVLEEVYPLWGKHLSEIGFPQFQVGNKVVTVPKDATTNRMIAIEPGINLWFQLSVGRQIARKLLGVGVDLNSQERNQRWARLGSLDRSLTTVDLSSASDSISIGVVRELIPPVWFQLMEKCRSHFGILRGKQIRWEKFSSMGNGFTFPLESLIFWAAARVATDYVCGRSGRVSVFGDDVILPTSAFETFSELMLFYGFRINRKKSHSVTFFRESCGAHWYSGVDIKPYYLKGNLSSVPAVYRAANSVRRLSHRFASRLACDKVFYPSWAYLMRKVPSDLRLRIPETLGDGGFISNLDEAVPSRAKHGFEGFHVQSLVTVSKTYEDDGVGVLLSQLWRLSSLPDINWFEGQPKLDYFARRLKSLGTLREQSWGNDIPMSANVKLRLVKSLVHQWYDLGPWV